MASNMDSVKGQSLSKVIDIFSGLLLKAMVTFGENKNFVRVGCNYFTEVGLKYLLAMKDLIEPAGKLAKRAKDIANPEFSKLLSTIASIEAKDKYQDRIQALIDHSKRYVGREISTTNVQDAALKQMISGMKKYQVKMIQQPEIKDTERVLNLLLSLTENCMRRTDLVSYSRSFKNPNFLKAIKNDSKYIEAEKKFFSTIKNFGMSFRTFYIFKNYYNMMIKKFQNDVDRSGKIVKSKPDYTKTDLQLLDTLTGFVDKITKVIEKVDWQLGPDIL